MEKVLKAVSYFVAGAVAGGFLGYLIGWAVVGVAVGQTVGAWGTLVGGVAALGWGLHTDGDFTK